VLWLGLPWLFAPLAQAQSTWSLRVDAVQQGELRLSDLEGRLALTTDGQWQLQDSHVAASFAGAAYGRLNFDAAAAESGWQGTLRWLAGDGLTLQGQWTVDPQAVLSVALEQQQIRLDGPIDKLQIRLRELSVGKWRRWLGRRLDWTPERLEGALSADLRWDGAGLSGKATATGLGFDTTDGRRAAAGVGFAAELNTLPEWQLKLDANRGEVLWDELYVALPEAGLQLQAQQKADGWQLAAAEAEVFQARLIWSSAAARPWQLDASVADLARWHERYLRSYFEARAWAAIAPVGTLQMSAKGAAAQVRELTVQASLAMLGLAAMSAEGIELEASWRAAGDGHLKLASKASWWSGISIAPWSLAARQSGAHWSLEQPLQLSLLGGQASVSQLDLSLAERPWSAQAALRIEDVDLAALMQALGWIALPGRLSADFPGARIEPQSLQLEGGAEVEAFGGRVELGAISIERPLGPAPAISGGFEFSGLDLAGVTAAFGFGEIEGELDGYVRGLRLLSGKPVAFDAWLASSESYRGPKLISQRAVDNLSAVGGGPGGAMSRSFLRVFERFRYDAIGLGCKLEQGACAMRGLERSNGGFLIVRGASLPRITVMGHATRVNWSSLVARLIAATEGGGPVVE
jgi:hypothetical protein